MDDKMKEEQSTPESGEEVTLEVAEKKTSKVEKPVPKMKSTYALPASSPEVLSKILKAYVIASKQGSEAVKYSDVAAVAALHPSIVSRNNAFLSEGGFITAERYGYYKPSPETTDYAKQAPWDEENAKGHIRALIDRTWFGETVQQQFQLQSTLNKSQLIRAFGSKATPDASDANRLGLLLDFLLHFEYLETDEQGNYIIRPKGEHTVDLSHALDVYVVKEKPPAEAQPLLPQSTGEIPSGGIVPRININLNLTPATTDEELELLIEKAKTALNLLLKRAD
jgi:hypothetical protein